MKDYQLAQINIAKMKTGIDDPALSGFVGRFEEINALAEQSPGFVWRLMLNPFETGYSAITGEFNVVVNMSVWETLDDLKNYVYDSEHLALLKAKNKWFRKMSDRHLALWWIPAGHTPGIQEGVDKLQLIQQDGPTVAAFSFTQSFAKPAR